MQYKRLDNRQRKARNWQLARNHLVCELLAKNPKMLSAEALKRANQIMRRR